MTYRFRPHCGAQILGQFNGLWWWATDALALTGSAAGSWYPHGWAPSPDDESEVLRVVLRYDGDRQQIVASWGGTSATYEPGPEPDRSELCA